MPYVLDKYLSEVEGHLRTLPPSVRQGEIDEMASHLQQLRADFLSRGHTVEEAEALATARFGTARRAGLRLRDVWEGNRGAWVTFFAALLSNYVLQLANMVAVSWLAFRLEMHSHSLLESLAPVMAFLRWWGVLLLPFGLNFALGRWGGRRTAGAVTASYVPLLLLLSLQLFSTFLVTTASFVYFVLAVMLVSILGAWSGSALKRRDRFAIIGGALPGEASARLLERRLWQGHRLLRRASTGALALALVSAAVFAFVRARVDPVLHPPTPEAAVRVMLSSRRVNPFKVEPATDVSTRLLPPTPTELKESERRVAYTATMHAIEYHRKSRIEELQHHITRLQREQIRAPRDRRLAYDLRSHRAALARLRPEGFTVSRVVRVKKTAEGWQLNEGPVGDSRQWDWLFNVYYHGPKAASKS